MEKQTPNRNRKSDRAKASETCQSEAGSPVSICFLEGRFLKAVQVPPTAVEGWGAHSPGVLCVKNY